MGIKLRSLVNPLVANLEDGYLNVIFNGDVIASAETDIPYTVSMPAQCNFFESTLSHMIGYLKSPNYTIIIRRNGTVDLLTRSFILLRQFKIDLSPIKKIEPDVCFCGSLDQDTKREPVILATLPTGESFIYSEHVPLTIELVGNDPVNKFLIDWSHEHNDVGTLILRSGSANYSDLWLDYGTGDIKRLSSIIVHSSQRFIRGIE